MGARPDDFSLALRGCRRPSRRPRRILDHAHLDRPLSLADNGARLDAVGAVHGLVIGSPALRLKSACNDNLTKDDQPVRGSRRPWKATTGIEPVCKALQASA